MSQKGHIELSALFKGDNAKAFMEGNGFEFKPIIYKYHSDVTTEFHPGDNGPIQISMDNSSIDKAFRSQYINSDLVLTGTEILKTYKQAQHDLNSFGPMFSLREQSWTIRKDTYGPYSIKGPIGDFFTIFNSVVPWKDFYQQYIEKKMR